MKKLGYLNLRFFPNSYLADDSISKMTFQVTNIAYYHKNEDKLVTDILRFLIRVANYPYSNITCKGGSFKNYWVNIAYFVLR